MDVNDGCWRQMGRWRFLDVGDDATFWTFFCTLISSTIFVVNSDPDLDCFSLTGYPNMNEAFKFIKMVYLVLKRYLSWLKNGFVLILALVWVWIGFGFFWWYWIVLDGLVRLVLHMTNDNSGWSLFTWWSSHGEWHWGGLWPRDGAGECPLLLYASLSRW